MVFRKHNSTAGFSLIEVLVAITLLGLVVVPIGSGLVLSFRLNARSDDVLMAQLAVSSAVETIMAEGYDPDAYNARFEGITITDKTADDVPTDTENNPIYYQLEFRDAAGYTCVETYVKPHPGGDS